MLKTIAAAAVAALVTGPALAATITNITNAPGSWQGVDPGQSLAITGTWTTAPAVVEGSVSGQYKSPFDPAGSGAPSGSALTNWQGIDYYTVGSPGKQASPAIMTFTADQSYLSLLWGSIDSYNAIQFWLNGVLVDTVGGTEVLNAGATPSASGAALVRITETFDELRFFSNYPNYGNDTPAFEFSHVVATVPLPAGGVLLIGAFGALAALRRRKTA
jgi:hypothetical protein